MLLRQMKYFAAVVECGSFTEAAEQCYISQSAISQQIRTLEKELGVELLHRRNRKFTVTTAGEYFYSQCRAVLAQVEELMQETRRLGTDRDLQLRIGYLLQRTGAAPGGCGIFKNISGGFICRLPIYQGDRQIMRNYCAFWRKEQANYYIEEFADTLKRLLEKRKNE